MGLVRLVARPMLGAMFVKGGIDQLSDPRSKAPVAADVTEPVRQSVGEPVSAMDDTTLVQVNGAAQVVGGLLLSFGKAPRLAAALLAGSLVPTTLAAHRFWEEQDPEQRAGQQVHFLKNLGLLGGLLLATMDTEGEPGLAWSAGHAVDHAKLEAEHAKELARLRAELAAAGGGAAMAGLAASARTAAAKGGAAAKVAGVRLGHAADVAKERAKHAGELAREKAEHAADTAGTRAELTGRRAMPDALDAGRALVSVLSSDDDEA